MENALIQDFKPATMALLLLGLTTCAPSSPRVTSTVLSSDGSIIYPAIAPDPSERSSSSIAYSFRFEGEKCKISAKVNDAIYEGAKAANKKVRMEESELKDLDWNAGYQVALVEEAHQASFFDALLGELRSLKEARQLDSDRYAELIAIFVQTIAYCTAPDQEPKFPVETFVDKCGDCDDKSRLLAGLLSREGYDVALFIFHPEKHMAVGIRSDGVSFKDSGYAYIETTSPAYIGFPSYEYSEVKLQSMPEVLRIGDGKTTYKSSDDVSFLHETLERQRAKAQDLKADLDKVKPKEERLKAEYDRMSRELTELKRTLSAGEHNKRASQTNRQADKVNAVVKSHNELVDRLNRSGEIIKHIIEHPDNRSGVVHWVREMLSE